jgi:hypothetical protein
MLEKVGRYLKQVVINHLVHNLRLMNQLVQSFERISAPAIMEIGLNEYLSELRNDSVEYGDSDLLGLDLRSIGLLQVRMSPL